MTIKKLDKDLIPIGEAANFLGVSIDTVRRWDENGTLAATRINGQRYFRLDHLKNLKLAKPLTISEASEVLGLSQPALRRLEEKGILVPKRNNNNERLYDRQLLDKFIQTDSFGNNKASNTVKTMRGFNNVSEKVEEVNKENKFLESVILKHEAYLDRLISFRRVFYLTGLFLATLFIVIISLLTVFFLFDPDGAVKVLSFKSSPPQYTSVNQEGSNVLDTFTQRSNLLALNVLKPFGNISLEVVRYISPPIYQKIIAKRKTTDLNEALYIDNQNNLITKIPLKINSAHLKITDTKLIKKLNADYLRGLYPGFGEGNLVIFGPGSAIGGLNIYTANIVNGAVTGVKIANDSIELGTKTTGDYVAGFTAGSGLVGNATGEGSNPTFSITAGDGISVDDNGIAINYSTSGITRRAQNENITGAWIFEGHTLFSFEPTLPHLFSPWPSGTSNITNATLLVNPDTAVADGNLIGAAVGGDPRFVVDTEGDIFAKNIILTGSVSSASTTIAGDLAVEGNSTFGDAPTDTVTFSARIGSHLIPTTDGTYDLGQNSTPLRWRNGYFSAALEAASLTTSGDIALNGGDLTTSSSTGNLFNSTATTVNLGGAATSLNLAGGSASTGCTIDGSGNLTCTANITGGSTGTVGYWTRSGTTLSPATAGDAITTSGNISTTGSGTGTFAGLLTASNGLTVSSGALALNSESLTFDGVTLVINGGGNVDIQDALNADSITSDAGVSIAASNSYTGAGAVTLSSGGAGGLTLNSASNTLTVDSTDTILSATGLATLTSSISLNLNPNTGSTYTLLTSATTLNLFNATTTTLSLAGAATTLNIGPTGSGASSALLSGGSSDTGCTLDGSNGNLTCSGDITGAATGTVGYWTRSGTTLSPATAGDSITTSGNISTSGSGSGTFAGLLTASNGLTLTTGALSLTSTSGTAALTLSSSTTAFNVQSGLFNIDTTNSRVGVGTTAPITTLDIGGFSTLLTGLEAKATIADNTNSISGVQMYNSNSGTTAEFRFLVADNAKDQYLAFSMPSSGNTSTLFGLQRNTLATIFVNSIGSGTDRILALGTVHNTDLFLGTNNLERLRITNAGKVGIGITAPTSLFHLKGAVTGKALAIFDETGDQNIIVASASGVTQATLGRTGNLAIEGTISDLTGATLVVDDDLQINGNDILDSGANTRITLGATTTLTNTTLTLSGTTTLTASSLTTLTTGGAFTIDGTSYVRVGDTATPTSASGDDDLFVEGDLEVDTAALFDGNVTLGDTSGDTVTANAASWTFVNDTNFVLSGGVNGLSFDTSTLSIDATNNKVGIGTTVPDQELQIGTSASAAGDADTQTGRLFVGMGGDSTQFATQSTTNAGTGIAVLNGAEQRFYSAGSYLSNEYMTMYSDAIRSLTISGPSSGGTKSIKFVQNSTGLLTTSFEGRVGIGTTSTTSLLHVTGAVTGKALAIFDETGDQSPFTASAGGIPIFTIVQAAGTDANGFTFTSAAAGSGVTLAATGTDTNIALSLDSKGTGALNLNNSATGDILLGGGSGSTGCTVTNSNGNLTCSGDITGAATGTVGYWTRSGTTLSPATVGDSVSISGNTTLGDASGDTVTSTAGTWTFSNATTIDLANSSTTSLNIESGLMDFDTTNSRIGIGTTAPSDKLHVDAGNILQTPSNPTYKGGANLTDSSNNVFVSGRYAYVPKNVNAGTCSSADPTGCEFQIYDVSDPTNPTFKGGADLANTTFAAYASGRYAYLVKDANGGTCNSSTQTGCEFQIYDVANPTSPTYKGGASFSQRGRSLFVSGRYAYALMDANAGTCNSSTATGCELQVYDITDPTSPTFKGGVNTGSAGTQSAKKVFVSGLYAYINENANAGTCSSSDATGCEFQVYDITDPTAPTYKGGADLANDSRGLFVSGRYAYVGKDPNAGTCSSSDSTGCEFQVYDVSDPTAPTYKGGANLTDETRDIFVSGRYAYVGKASNAGTCNSSTQTGCEFQVYDVSGVEATSVMAHSLEAGSFQVRDSATINNQLYVQGGLDVGIGGILSNGAITATNGLTVNGLQTGKALAIFNETGDQSPFTASESGNTVFVIDHPAGTIVNGFEFTPSATGNAVAELAYGTDTNIGFNLDAKGTGVVKIAGTSTGGVELGGSGTGDILLAGGSGSTGCTITNSTGNITCSGDLQINGNDIKDSGGNTRITLSTSQPNVDITGTVQMTIEGDAAGVDALCGSTALNGDVGDTADETILDCSGSPTSDYAEIYPTKNDVDYGDLVAVSNEIVKTKKVINNKVIEGEYTSVAKLEKSSKPYQDNVIGVTSNNYGDFSSTGHGVVDDSDHPLPVALAGRVPVKISSQSKEIKAGDFITSSSESGKAMKAEKAGIIVGKALEDWTADSGKDKIIVFMNVSYADPNDILAKMYIDDSGSLVLPNNTRIDSNVILGSGSTSLIASSATPDSGQARMTIQDSLNSLKARLDNLENKQTNSEVQTKLDELTKDISYLKDQLTTASVSATLETATSLLDEKTATLSALTITGKTNLYDLAVVGDFNIGTIFVDGIKGTIDSLGQNLSLQSVRSADISLEGGSVVIDKDGNIKLNEGRIIGSDQIRGINVAVDAGNTDVLIKFSKPRPTPAYAVTVAPSWLTQVAVVDKKEDGFTVKFSTPPQNSSTLDWIIID